MSHDETGWERLDTLTGYWNSFPSSIVFVFIREPPQYGLFRTEIGGEEKNNIYIAIILVRLPECVLCLIQLEK